MELDYYEYTLAEQWASPIVNGDGDLTDEEQGQLDAWLEALPEHVFIDFPDEESYFARDEISGLHAQCVTCKIFFQATGD